MGWFVPSKYNKEKARRNNIFSIVVYFLSWFCAIVSAVLSPIMWNESYTTIFVGLAILYFIVIVSNKQRIAHYEDMQEIIKK